MIAAAFTVMAVSRIGKVVFPLAMNTRHLADYVDRPRTLEALSDSKRKAALLELQRPSRHL